MQRKASPAPSTAPGDPATARHDKLAVAEGRVLLYVPIVHTQADMGALGDAFKRALVVRLGERWWELNVDLVDKLWTEIEGAVGRLNLVYERVRIYQDGLPVCGRELEIVTDLARAGSRNHRLLLRLRERGALIMGTESAELLVEEYQLAKQLVSAAPSSMSEKQRELAHSLLEGRDRFIAERINSTLGTGETGIVFLGLLHSLKDLLATNIHVSNLLDSLAGR